MTRDPRRKNPKVSLVSFDRPSRPDFPRGIYHSFFERGGNARSPRRRKLRTKNPKPERKKERNRGRVRAGAEGGKREREMQIDGLRRRRTSTANHVPTSAESDQGPANRKTKSSLHGARYLYLPFLSGLSPSQRASFHSPTASFLLAFYEPSSILLSVSGPIDRATWEKAHGARGFRPRRLARISRCVVTPHDPGDNRLADNATIIDSVASHRASFVI